MGAMAVWCNMQFYNFTAKHFNVTKAVDSEVKCVSILIYSISTEQNFAHGGENSLKVQTNNILCENGRTIISIVHLPPPGGVQVKSKRGCCPVNIRNA